MNGIYISGYFTEEDHRILDELKNELEENGYIEKTRRGLGKNNLYKIIRG